MSDLQTDVQEKPSARLLSLDAFRGITIAFMILVNNPGSWGSIYWPLQHAQWDGWTPTDLVFPFFLFIVGVSITLSSARRVESGDNIPALFRNVVRRTLIIFGLGLFLNGFPFFHLSTIRIPGVLQRIALCYFFASIIFIKTRWRTQAIVTATLLVVYWVLMKTVAAPGFAAGDLSKEGNLAAYIDRALMPGHIYTKVYDPEGLLSTIPAIATTLLGVLSGQLIRSKRTSLEKVAAMFVAGMAGVVLGWCLNPWFPINKALWTSSYVLFTAGLGLQLLALFYWLIEIKGYKAWAKPLVIFGVNAIAVYVLSGVVGRLMSVWKIPRPDGSMGDLKAYIFDHAFLTWASPINASLAFAICYVLFWLFIMWLLYRKKVFIKV